METVAYDVEASSSFKHSPFRLVLETGSNVRQPLNLTGPHLFPIYDELRGLGHTDYAAWPLDHTQGRRHLITFATARPAGFTEKDIVLIREALPLFSLVTEIRIKDQLARTLLRTYVGPHASEQILDGATTRGSGATISAAIMVCDLRNFTALSVRRSRDDVIEVLNRYFDLVAEPIELYGGEILKFTGDGLLAVFPLDRPDACQRLILAVRRAYELASGDDTDGKNELLFGTGIHVGEVMYGNIGSKRRLDFTVIGPAVNLASRLESLTKELRRPVLLSDTFVRTAELITQTEYMGRHVLKGFDGAFEIHSLPLQARSV
ncbi:adenylate/guanylate cyclase domain-containing protein [Rhizobium sp. CECT 9324]|uniref:adenylate/guanylate cyclase domain-containing protein n=1 Tax=Rhizobium sp. CECT 9324 TaxID=2845820 RepID=UPI001E521D48|nr:adenylate/guanylate cyclase domain-containing protein [Rhizobium sp. CECT 9324]CAH0340861.1 hypothetical protein RHI9324_02543 [Rhizobium sp. CECT 9324]